MDTASEALALSLAERAKIDLSFMTELTGKPEAEIIEELTGVIFQNPLTESGKLQMNIYQGMSG